MERGISSSSLTGNDIRFLVTLLQKGTSNLSGLGEAIKNTSSRKNTMKKLSSLGLVEYTFSETEHFSYKVWLTDLGMQVATLVKMTEDCLVGKLDVEKDSLDELALKLLASARSKNRVNQ